MAELTPLQPAEEVPVKIAGTFQKKQVVPEVIDAAQWYPPEDPRYNADAHPIVDAAKAVDGSIVARVQQDGSIVYAVQKLIDYIILSPGDYLTTDADGNKAAIQSDQFERHFEPAAVDTKVTKGVDVTARS